MNNLICYLIYDFCLMANVKLLIFAFIGFIVFLYILAFNTLKRVSLENKNLVLKHNFCKSCGFKIDGDICPKCGTRQE